MSESAKDTIYIDVDDEITSIIEKVRGGKHKIVALVLPKRATMLQSIVNMKLLKRTSDDANKHIVLITSEAGLLPLAGAVGLHVAKTLQSKPAIPPPPEMPKTAETVVEESVDGAEESEIDGSKSIGELAGLPPEPKADAEETIDIEDEPEAKAAKGKKKGQGNLKVPNFDRFRTRLFLAAGGLILLIILWFFAYHVLPKAKITIKTDTLSVSSTVAFTADTAAKALDEDSNVIPAEPKTVKKTDAQKVAATGQKNIGEKATGTVTLKNCTKVDGSVSIPQGTAAIHGSLTFITSETVSLPASTFSGGGTCTTGTKDVNVVAQNGGAQYNLSGGRTFTIGGFAGVNGTDSSAMTGGTDKTVTVVSQQDIDGAKQKIVDNNSAAKTDLIKAFKAAGKYGLGETIAAGTPVVTASPNVGDQASEVNVSVTTDYTMLGVKENDLKKLIENEAKKQIDIKKEAIADHGLEQATFSVTDKKSNTTQTLSVQTIVSTGARIDAEALKKQITGKKRGDVQSIVQALPGVKDVTIDYSPFWVYKTPKQTGKITITIQKPQTKQ